MDECVHQHVSVGPVGEPTCGTCGKKRPSVDPGWIQTEMVRDAPSAAFMLGPLVLFVAVVAILVVVLRG